MGSTERRERERLELRTKILDAARDLFVAEGYDAVTMRKIAEKIEYSPTAIYAHFPDKDALVRALCETDFLAIAAELAPIASIEDPVERMRVASKIYVNFAARFPNHYRLMFLTPWPKHKHVDDPRIGNPQYDAYALTRSLSEEAIEKGKLRPDLTDADLVAQTVWAGLHGVIALQLVSGCDDDWVPWRPLDARVEAMVDALLRGMLR